MTMDSISVTIVAPVSKPNFNKQKYTNFYINLMNPLTGIPLVAHICASI